MRGPKKLADGHTQVMSRYHPITTYSRCSNNRQWAMCLDSPCTIDPTNPADKTKPQKAQCKCSVTSGQDWLVKPGTAQCTNGLISSATVVDLDQITDYLETHPELHIPNFSVVNVVLQIVGELSDCTRWRQGGSLSAEASDGARLNFEITTQPKLEALFF